MQAILKAMNIPTLQADGFEADDVIGTLATKAGAQGIITYMLTPDKDYGQLISPNVFMYRPRHGGGYDVVGTKEVKEKYGIDSPHQVIDLLALMGDSADNYPGCPGVGEKTAVKLINQFGSCEGLLEHTDQLKGKMREKVEGAADDIKMAKFLATIRTDVPVELNLEALRVTAPDKETLGQLFDELEFKTLATKMLGKPKNIKQPSIKQLDIFATNTTDGSEKQNDGLLASIKTQFHEYKLIDNEEDAQKICDFLMTKEILSLDTETTSTNTIDAELVGLSFAVRPHEAWYVAVPADHEAAQRMVEIFRPLYENPSILKVGQNIKYDYEVLRKYGIDIQGEMFDTMIAHYLIQPELRHNMDFMAETLLHYHTVHIEELIGPAGKNQKNMRDLDPQDVYEYAAEDADITLQLKEVLEPKLQEVGAVRLFHDMEMPLVRVLADMELSGVRLDTTSLKETEQIFNERMKQYEEHAYELAGKQFNISSPKQVGEILFDTMHIVEKPKRQSPVNTSPHKTCSNNCVRTHPSLPISSTTGH